MEEFDPYESGYPMLILTKEPEFVKELRKTDNNNKESRKPPIYIPSRQSGKTMTEFKKFLRHIAPEATEDQITRMMQLMFNISECNIDDMEEKASMINDIIEKANEEKFESISDYINGEIADYKPEYGLSDSELHKRIKYAKNPMERQQYERLLSSKDDPTICRHHPTKKRKWGKK